jgi:hypothetical protein
MASTESYTLGIIIAAWFIFYLLAKRFKLDEKGLDWRGLVRNEDKVP